MKSDGAGTPDQLLNKLMKKGDQNDQSDRDVGGMNFSMGILSILIRGEPFAEYLTYQTIEMLRRLRSQEYSEMPRLLNPTFCERLVRAEHS
jgi:hypothetical protein